MKNPNPIVPEDFLKLISVRVPMKVLHHCKVLARANGMDTSSFIRQGMIRNIEAYTSGSRR